MTGEANEMYLPFAVKGIYIPADSAFAAPHVAAAHISKVLTVCLPVVELEVTLSDEV